MISHMARTFTRKAVLHRSLWTGVLPMSADPILGLVARYKQDPNPRAVNLAQGAYRDDDGRPFVLESVKKAETQVLRHLLDGIVDKEYLGVEGNPDFCAASARFAFGDDCLADLEDRVVAIQSISGTGSLRLAAESLRRIADVDTIWLSTPTWGNHAKIFEAGGLTTRSYRYLDTTTNTTLDFEGMCEDLETVVPEGSVVLLHACAHNPTGVDPSPEQWAALASIFERKELVPLFDSAYQGYASGDPDVDAAAIREFARRGTMKTMLVCQSYAKNMGLYGERIGALNIVTASAEAKEAVLSQVKTRVIRPMYSSPPLHGARVATMLLTDEKLNQAWRADLKTMSSRIKRVRSDLAEALENNSRNNGRSWTHITDQSGMFAFTGLTAGQVTRLLDEHGIYLTLDGRMSLAGLRSADVGYVAEAMVEVTSTE